MATAQQPSARHGPPGTRSAVDWLPYALLLPAVLFLVVFFVYPMVQAIASSLRSDDGGFTLRHFEAMLADTYFRDALRNSFLLTAIVIPLQLTAALAIALMVNTRFRGHTWFLYICAIPLGISDLAAGLIWLSIFTERGYLNAFLQWLGVVRDPITFLSVEHPVWLYGAIIATEIWRATAIVMVILVAGLQLIPKDYFETADVFGAGGWRKLRFVTLPLLRPTIQTALIIRTILAFQLFATVITMAGRLVPVLAGEVFFQHQVYRNAQMATAYAVMIMVISMVITGFYLSVLGTRAEELGRG